MNETAKNAAAIALAIIAVIVVAAVPALREPVFTWIASTITTVVGSIWNAATTVISWLA